MPTCQNCHNKWSWIQTFKKMFTLTLESPMKCPYCGAEQYYTRRARKRTIALTLPLAFIALLNLLSVSPYLLGGTYLVACLSVLAINPFLIELSNE